MQGQWRVLNKHSTKPQIFTSYLNKVQADTGFHFLRLKCKNFTMCDFVLFLKTVNSSTSKGSMTKSRLLDLYVAEVSFSITVYFHLPHRGSRKPRGLNHQGHVTVCSGTSKGREKAGEKVYAFVCQCVHV